MNISRENVQMIHKVKNAIGSVIARMKIGDDVTDKQLVLFYARKERITRGLEIKIKYLKKLADIPIYYMETERSLRRRETFNDKLCALIIREEKARAQAEKED